MRRERGNDAMAASGHAFFVVGAGATTGGDVFRDTGRCKRVGREENKLREVGGVGSRYAKGARVEAARKGGVETQTVCAK